MCYPLPGPRCAGHLTNDLAKLQRDMMLVSDEEEMNAIQLRKAALERDLDATPEGRKRLNLLVETAESEGDIVSVKYYTARIAYGHARWEMKKEALAVAQGRPVKPSQDKAYQPQIAQPPVAPEVAGKRAVPPAQEGPQAGEVINVPAKTETPPAPEVTPEQVARGRELKKYLEEHGGLALFPALYDKDGNLVHAEYMEGPSRVPKKENEIVGYWRIWREQPNGKKATKDEWFTPSAAKNPDLRVKNNAKKGFFVGAIAAPAQVVRNNKTGAVYLSRVEKGFANAKPFITKPAETGKVLPKVTGEQKRTSSRQRRPHQQTV